jgi:hypothetical protein
MTAQTKEIRLMAEKALKIEKFLIELMDGLSIKNHNEKRRRLSSQVLILISEEFPDILYKKWGFFVDLLKYHTFCKFPAIYIIANLTKVDSKNKFDKISDKYFLLLADTAVSIASHASLNLGKIARYKPKLREKITKKLLSIDSIYPNPDRVELVKAYVVEGLKEYFEEIKDKKDIIDFVRRQTGSKSGKTKKIAKQFLSDFNL